MVPNVAAPEEQAYDVAYAKALRHVLAMEDVPPHVADEARDTLAGLEPAEQDLRLVPRPGSGEAS